METTSTATNRPLVLEGRLGRPAPRSPRACSARPNTSTAAVAARGRASTSSTAHDGFTLTDTVSFNDKHNDANGEGNRDGHSDNRSWNCGVEGETEDEDILDLRDRMPAR